MENLHLQGKNKSIQNVHPSNVNLKEIISKIGLYNLEFNVVNKTVHKSEEELLSKIDELTTNHVLDLGKEKIYVFIEKTNTNFIWITKNITNLKIILKNQKVLNTPCDCIFKEFDNYHDAYVEALEYASLQKKSTTIKTIM